METLLNDNKRDLIEEKKVEASGGAAGSNVHYLIMTSCRGHCNGGGPVRGRRLTVAR
jgi:hypothetical protein